MDPDLIAVIALLEPVLAIGSLVGLVLCVKWLIWGKGPIRRLRQGVNDPDLSRRVAELEERLEHAADVTADHADLLEDLVERLDFTERMLTRQNAAEPKALGERAASTPV